MFLLYDMEGVNMFFNVYNCIMNSIFKEHLSGKILNLWLYLF